MDDQKHSPVKFAAQYLVAAQTRGSLVARGLAATNEAYAEKLFRQGMRYRYDSEYGMPSDTDKTYEYFLKAAKLDHAEAQYELEYLNSELGDSAQKWDRTEPDVWLERSARLGFGPAQYDFAVNHELPEDEYEQMIEAAFAWYEDRAQAGDAQRQFEFAEIHLRGDVDAANRAEGLSWLKASAAQENQRACLRLGIEILESLPTPAAVAEAIHLLERAADLGDARACEKLSHLYLCGHPGVIHRLEPQAKLVAVDLQKADFWCDRATQLGHGMAAYHLGCYLLNGEHLPQNLALAEKWLLRAANAGYDSAQIRLGAEYESGNRFEKNNELAIHWYKKAVEKGRWPAMYRLAHMLEIGSDFEQAMSLYKQAACYGHEKSQQRLNELGINWET
jgi:TPR repeat protein